MGELHSYYLLSQSELVSGCGSLCFSIALSQAGACCLISQWVCCFDSGYGLRLTPNGRGPLTLSHESDSFLGDEEAYSNVDRF